MAQPYNPQQIATDYLAQNPDFGTLGGELGSGNFGTAFSTSKGLVIKVTRDSNETIVANKIMTKANGQFTPKYYKLDKVSNGTYVLVMDHVTPIQLSASESNMLNVFRDRVLDALEDGNDPSAMKPMLKKLGNPKLEKVLGGVIDCLVGLNRIGIRNADVQEDNLGVVNGRVVMIDVVDERDLSLNEAALLGTIKKLVREYMAG
jgi:hypothetical protein